MPFEKGRSGNPNGRPKRNETLTEVLREIAENRINPEDKKSITYKKALGLKWWQLAINGDVNAIINLYKRIDGKEKEYVEITNENVPTVIGFNFTPVKIDDENKKVLKTKTKKKKRKKK